MGVSIDGYVATIDGAHDWGYDGEDPATKKWKLDSAWGAGAHLMGRQTYEDMAAVWPESSSDYAAPMNEIPKVAALGDGPALFKDLPGRLALELVEAHTYSTGAAIHVYRPRWPEFSAVREIFREMVSHQLGSYLPGGPSSSAPLPLSRDCRSAMRSTRDTSCSSQSATRFATKVAGARQGTRHGVAVHVHPPLRPPHGADRGDRAQVLDQDPVDGESALA